jgi:hypothetical protein
MLVPAIRYKDELAKFHRDVIYGNPLYQYWNYSSYWKEYDPPCSDDWSSICRVSIDSSKKLLGYLSAHVSRSDTSVSSISMYKMNLDTISFTFVRDLEKFITSLFEEHRMKKISFSVVIGNPAERLYDAGISKFGGRVVGTKLQEVILTDGNTYDVKLYEILTYCISRRCK